MNTNSHPSPLHPASSHAIPTLELEYGRCTWGARKTCRLRENPAFLPRCQPPTVIFHQSTKTSYPTHSSTSLPDGRQLLASAQSSRPTGRTFQTPINSLLENVDFVDQNR